jgi:hypothetical protein
VAAASDDFLGDRRKQLEESFFHAENERLKTQLVAKKEAAADKAAVSEVSGVQDDQALDALVEMGLGRETLAALGLVPLVAVAWADGSVDEKERRAILEAAATRGFSKDGTCHQLLESWLSREPAEDLMTAWASFVEGLAKTLTDEARVSLKDDVVSRSTDVARAAGGFLGVASISKEEKAMLERVGQAFG